MQTMLNYYKLYWLNAVKFDGRSRRAEYWYPILMNMIIGIVLAVVIGMLPFLSFLDVLFNIAIFVPTLAVSIRRLHDIGKSGWWYLFAAAGEIILEAQQLAAMDGMVILLVDLVILVANIILLVWACKEGDHGDNAYGPDPKQTQIF